MANSAVGSAWGAAVERRAMTESSQRVELRIAGYRLRQNDGGQVLQLKMRAGWARSHCNENVARAYVFGGGHDGREAVLIGRDCACEEPRRTGTRFRAQRVAAQFTSRIGGLPAPTWSQTRLVLPSLDLQRPSRRSLARPAAGTTVRSTQTATIHSPAPGSTAQETWRTGQKSGRVRCWERHRRLHAHSRLDWRDLP